MDARIIADTCSIWITDPPYADAINYHELSEFFLAWHQKILPDVFPNWVPDSHRALAIRGSDEDFRKGMIESYRNLTNHMPDNGMQIVMFTHQDAGVWADLTLILWASGLSVTAAWCIQTETESGGIKKGNYVQGTVLLILRKQTSEKTAFLDEIYPEIEDEVKSQPDSMTKIDDKEDPNFSDTDYQLAAYAAALRVLTGYKQIEGIDVGRELARTRTKGEVSELEKVIQVAVKIACNHLMYPGGSIVTFGDSSPRKRNSISKVSNWKATGNFVPAPIRNWPVDSGSVNINRSLLQQKRTSPGSRPQASSGPGSQWRRIWRDTHEKDSLRHPADRPD